MRVARPKGLGFEESDMGEEYKDGDITEPVKARDDYWDAYAEAFAQPLQANGLLAKFVTNPNVTGAYAEAWLRSMTKNMLGHRFRISTGAVIRGADATRGLASVPQCDLIVWDPSEMPAIFESGEFALVPFFAARAVIEIKRTAKRKELAEQLKERRDRLPAFGPVLGVVIDHPQRLFDQVECTPDWLKHFKYKAGEQTRYNAAKEPPMTSLLNENARDMVGIMAFIYFLAQLAGYTNTMACLPETPQL
jgi:hypothetical protein